MQEEESIQNVDKIVNDLFVPIMFIFQLTHSPYEKQLY